MTEPKLETKVPQPYAAVVLELTQPEISQKAPPLIADVIAWVRTKGGETAGPPFFNYVRFAPGGQMTMQVGMPTRTLLEGDKTMTTGTLPGGRYAVLTHTGPYHELKEANMALGDWARTEGLVLDGHVESNGFAGATRLEIYRDPGQEPSGHPVTEVAFRIAG